MLPSSSQIDRVNLELALELSGEEAAAYLDAETGEVLFVEADVPARWTRCDR
jgi:hypothetical protein